jgi:hypothetical protein
MTGTLSENDVPIDRKAAFEKALAEFYTVYLIVVYHPEVVLPDYLMTPKWRDQKAAIFLEYGLEMAVPISDLTITDAGVTATLSFLRSPYATFVPWEAVVGMRVTGERPPAPKPRFKLKAV